jgi:hypothetical protein
MPSKGQIQAERDAAARKQRSFVSIRLAVREALDAGLSAEDTSKAFAEVLCERGRLGSADDVVAVARSARKK